MYRFLTILVLAMALFIGALLIRDRLTAGPSSARKGEAQAAPIVWPGPNAKSRLR